MLGDYPEIMEFAKYDLLTRFTQRLRARHAFDKKEWEVYLELQTEIDFNTVRVVVCQRFLPNRKEQHVRSNMPRVQ